MSFEGQVTINNDITVLGDGDIAGNRRKPIRSFRVVVDHGQCVGAAWSQVNGIILAVGVRLTNGSNERIDITRRNVKNRSMDSQRGHTNGQDRRDGHTSNS